MRKLVFIYMIGFVSCVHAAAVAWNEVMLFKDAGGIKDFYSMMWTNVQLDSGRSFNLQLDMMLTIDGGGLQSQARITTIRQREWLIIGFPQRKATWSMRQRLAI